MGSRPGGIGGHNLQSTAGTLLTTSVGKKNIYWNLWTWLWRIWECFWSGLLINAFVAIYYIRKCKWVVNSWCFQLSYLHHACSAWMLGSPSTCCCRKLVFSNVVQLDQNVCCFGTSYRWPIQKSLTELIIYYRTKVGKSLNLQKTVEYAVWFN